MLEIIGENVGADRSYMFRYTNTALTRSDNEYEWVRKGIQPQIHNLQNVDMSNMPTWTRMLSSHQDIIIPDISNPARRFGNGSGVPARTECSLPSCQRHLGERHPLRIRRPEFCKKYEKIFRL